MYIPSHSHIYLGALYTIEYTICRPPVELWVRRQETSAVEEGTG